MSHLLPAMLSALIACSLNAAELFDGNWSFNSQRSEIHQGLRMTIERRGNAIHYASGGIEYTALQDGGDYPLRGLSGHPTVSLIRKDSRTIERIYKLDGKTASTATLRVSADGKLLTVRTLPKASNSQDGTPGVIRNVYERISTDARTDPFAGEWERHFMRYLGHSHSTITYSTSTQGELVFAGGAVTYNARYDGADHPVSGAVIADSIALKRIDSKTTEETWKEQGRIVAVIRRTLSSDGDTMTAWTSETDAGGPPIRSFYVYDRIR